MRLALALAFLLVATSSCKHTVLPPPAGEGESEGEGSGGEGEGEGCPAAPVLGLIVPVIDNCTTFHVCGAAVTISEAGATQTLDPVGSTPQDCAYQGASDAPGTYEIDVTATGYQPFSLSDITVDVDGCGHAVPRTVTVRLTPTAPCG